MQVYGPQLSEIKSSAEGWESLFPVEVHKVIFMHNKIWEPAFWMSIFLIDTHLGKV